MIYGTSIQVTDVPDIRFAAQRSRCPRTVSKQCMVKTSLDAEANSNVQYIRRHFSERWLYDFEKPKHTQMRRSATTSYRPWRLRCARVKRQLLGTWPRELPHLRELLLFCACVRAGANLRPNLETAFGEERPCPDLSLRSGLNTPFH